MLLKAEHLDVAVEEVALFGMLRDFLRRAHQDVNWRLQQGRLPDH